MTLRFTLDNTSSLDATDIAFTDNLGAFEGALSGLAAVPPLPTSPCGATLSGTTSLTFLGGSVDAGMSCMFDVTLLVPAGAASDTYGNTTTNLIATLNGSPVVIDPATDGLIVSSDLLLLTNSFTDDPVAPGGTVTLEFTLTNLDSGTITDIAFTDDLEAALAGLAPTAGGLPMDGFCGPASSLTFDTMTGILTLAGGMLTSSEICTFSTTLTVPAGAPTGAFPNLTSGVTR